MHSSAAKNFKHFIEVYAKSFSSRNDIRLLEIGSYDANGSLRSIAPSSFEYIGVDFCEGPGVDIVLNDPYVLPFESESVDIVVSTSCFEHSEMFWILFLEIMRVLKPSGLFYLQVPSNGTFHQYPVDCWRFYPDSGKALSAWGKRNSYKCALIESYTSLQDFDIWNDYVAVFIKDELELFRFPERILERKLDITNGLIFGSNDYINFTSRPEDIVKYHGILRIICNKIKYRLGIRPKYKSYGPSE